RVGRVRRLRVLTLPRNCWRLVGIPEASMGSESADGSMMSTVGLDQHDERILSELQSEARITMAALGRRVGLSQPAVTERVRKLETSGIITGYHAAVDPARLGYSIRAMVRVGRFDYNRLMKCIEATPEVINAYNVTGEHSWLL